MNSKGYIFLVALGWLLAVALTAVADPPASSRWKVGDMWDLQIELADKTTFILHAMVGGTETVKGFPCWQLTLLPGKAAPAQLKNQRHRVVMDQKSGRPLSTLRVKDKQALTVITAGPVSFITDAPEGIPLELFNPDDLPGGKATVAGTSRRIELRKQEMADHYFLEMAFFDRDVEEWKIRQQWAPGEKWWHTYERTVKGQKTLTARRLNAAPLKAEVAAKKQQDLVMLAARFPLRMDPRLRNAKLSAVGSDLRLADLLELLRTATGLELAMADNLTYHEPTFGPIKLPDAPAWMLMELIAEKDMENGKWEKAEDGYMLTGTSKALNTPPRRFPWGWVGGAGLLICATTGYGIYRSRRKRSATVVPSPVSKAEPKKATAGSPPGKKHAKPS